MGSLLGHVEALLAGWKCLFAADCVDPREQKRAEAKVLRLYDALAGQGGGGGGAGKIKGKAKNTSVGDDVEAEAEAKADSSMLRACVLGAPLMSGDDIAQVLRAATSAVVSDSLAAELVELVRDEAVEAEAEGRAEERPKARTKARTKKPSAFKAALAEVKASPAVSQADIAPPDRAQLAKLKVSKRRVWETCHVHAPTDEHTLSTTAPCRSQSSRPG